MMNRTKKAFTLLELIIVVVVLGILALVAVPSFKGVIDNTSADVAESTARAIARDANALAAFNTGTDTNQATNANIDTAVGETMLSTDDGWAVDTAEANGADITLTKNGTASIYCISVTAASGSQPARATVSSGDCA